MICPNCGRPFDDEPPTAGAIRPSDRQTEGVESDPLSSPPAVKSLPAIQREGHGSGFKRALDFPSARLMGLDHLTTTVTVVVDAQRVPMMTHCGCGLFSRDASCPHVWEASIVFNRFRKYNHDGLAPERGACDARK